MNKMFEKYFISCPKGYSFSERMERSGIPQRSEDHFYWGFAPVKRRYE
jgi:hypothetical protein